MKEAVEKIDTGTMNTYKHNVFIYLIQEIRTQTENKKRWCKLPWDSSVHLSVQVCIQAPARITDISSVCIDQIFTTGGKTEGEGVPSKTENRQNSKQYYGGIPTFLS